MRRALAVAVITIAAACAPPAEQQTQEGTTPAGAEPLAETDPWESFEWLTGEAHDGRLWLQFSPDESDNVHMLFECDARGAVSAEAFDPRGEGMQLVLTSGDERAAYPSRPIRDEAGDFFGDAVKSRADVSSNDPVIVSFRQMGELSLGEPPHPFRTATSEERQRIEAFFQRCAER